MDIACFSGPYFVKADDVVALLETKGFSKRLYYAGNQARLYAARLPNCRVVIITNGFCYKTFLRQDNRLFLTTPSAYLNLLKPRARYPLDPVGVGGALDVLNWLLPGKLLRGG